MAYKNAFTALGFDNGDATIFALRAQFARIVRDRVREKKLTQEEASEWLRVSQGAVSEIVSGRIKSKSVEYFIRLLARANIPWTASCMQAPNVSVFSQSFQSEATQNVFAVVEHVDTGTPFTGAMLRPDWYVRSSGGVLQ